MTTHTEEKAKEDPNVHKERPAKDAPQPGPPVHIQASLETENELVILRGQGPLLSEGVYGPGPILETISQEEHGRREKAAKEAKEEEEKAAKEAKKK